MTPRRSRFAGKIVAVALAATWLPYLVLQCPSCPGAETTLVRCAGLMKAAASPAGADSVPSTAKPKCHGGSHHTEGSREADSGCCNLENRRGTTAKVSISLPVPAALPGEWAPPPITIGALRRVPYVGFADQLGHSPPRFLLHRSLLL